MNRAARERELVRAVQAVVGEGAGTRAEITACARARTGTRYTVAEVGECLRRLKSAGQLRFIMGRWVPVP